MSQILFFPPKSQVSSPGSLKGNQQVLVVPSQHVLDPQLSDAYKAYEDSKSVTQNASSGLRMKPFDCCGGVSFPLCQRWWSLERILDLLGEQWDKLQLKYADVRPKKRVYGQKRQWFKEV